MFSDSLVVEFTCVHLTAAECWMNSRRGTSVADQQHGRKTDGNVSGRTRDLPKWQDSAIAGKTEHGIGMNAFCRLATLPTLNEDIPDAGKTNQY